jgi:hypothetical protein
MKMEEEDEGRGVLKKRFVLHGRSAKRAVARNRKKKKKEKSATTSKEGGISYRQTNK